MGYVHIIAAWIAFILLTASYLIARICVKQSLVSDETDFITDTVRKKQKQLERDSSKISIRTYMCLMFGSPIVLGIISYVFIRNAMFTVTVIVAALLTPEGFIRVLKRKGEKDFEERFSRSLEQLASSLKAGLTIMQAVQEVADNKFIHVSIRKRYQKLNTDLQMGISIKDAFYHFAEGTNSKDARDVAVAIDIQDAIGGHEAEVLMTIAKDIHDRLVTRKEIKSMFSGTSSMVLIMDFLPFFVMFFLANSDSSFRDFYFSSLPNVFIFVGIMAVCIIGSVLNHRTLRKILKGV